MIDIVYKKRFEKNVWFMTTFDISDDSSYQDEESSESNKSEFKIKQDRKHQLGGRTVSSLSVPTAGSQDNCESVSIPVPRCEIFGFFSPLILSKREKNILVLLS